MDAQKCSKIRAVVSRCTRTGRSGRAPGGRPAGRSPARVQSDAPILDELIYSEVEKVDGEEKYRLIANCAYSYEMVRSIGKKVAKRPEFADHKLVKGLSFSSSGMAYYIVRI